MTRKAFGPVLLIVLLLLIATSACGSDGEQEATSAEPDPSTPNLMSPVSEQELGQARATFELAKSTWDGGNHRDYILVIGIQTISRVRHTVVDGELVSSEVVMSDDGIERLPTTVEALFDQVDGMIGDLEADPGKIQPPGECGWHLNVRFDPVLGYPTYYDGLGPCDDGVGVEASVELPE